MDAKDYAERVAHGYRKANLSGLLAQIRAPGRYADAHGEIALTAGELGLFNPVESGEQLIAAANARRNGQTEFKLAFNHPQRGLCHGLNPYTDWSMSILRQKPRHTYLFLGLDFYSVADLSKVGDWTSYLQNPFRDRDLFWHRLWAWIMHKTVDTGKKYPVWEQTIQGSDAASFVQADGGAFIFHNLIPYLRPAYMGSTAINWPQQELRKEAIKQCIIDDLSMLRELSAGPMRAHCTNQAAARMLRAAGFAPDDIICWGAHPSKIFHPSTLYRRNLYFKAQEAR